MKQGFYTLILFMVTGNLFSQTWNGSTSTDWNTASNWDNNAVPSASASVIINSNAVTYQPKLTSNVTVKEVTMSAGKLNLNGFSFTLTNKGALTGGIMENGSLIISKTLDQMQAMTFNGPFSITQTGSSGSNNSWAGGNTFNNAVTITNNSPRDMEMAATTGDVYNGNMTFVQATSGSNLYIASAGTNNFKGDISTIGSVVPVVFGKSGGIVAVSGSSVQSLNGPVAQAPVIYNLTMNSSKGLILNVPLTINTAITFTNGFVYSTSTNLLILNDNVTTTGASNNSHVAGPVRKIGNEAFTFPTGKGSLYAPISISAPSAATDHFTAEYFNTPTPHSLSLLDILLNHVSKEEYWSLNRTNGLSSVFVTLSYSVADRSGPVTSLIDLRISRWNSLLTLSSNYGNGATTGNTTAGTVKSSSAMSLFGDFTLASSSTQNPLQLVTAPTSMNFRNPTKVNATTWQFNNVRNGVDAIVSIIGNKNASLDAIDDSATYKYAWQPFIRFGNAATKTTDSSYVEFKIDFVKNGMPEVQKSVAMTIIDQDGEGTPNGYRELLKVSQPAVPKGILSSEIKAYSDVNFVTLVGSLQNFNSIDTNKIAAMSQINFTNVSSYVMRVGVLGKVSNNTVRQSSFSFKNFTSMNVVLPVKLMNISAAYIHDKPVVSWTTTEEHNLNNFEVYRSVDGKTFTMAGTVKAAGFTQSATKYVFADQQLAAKVEGTVYYKLRMVDFNGDYKWSSIVKIDNSKDVASNNTTTISNVYPNPTKGMLNVNFTSVAGADFSIQVVDMFGKTIQSYQNSDLNADNSLSLDMTDLSNGVYFIKVNNNDGSSTSSKFVKN
jgi:hypothetical protein